MILTCVKHVRKLVQATDFVYDHDIFVQDSYLFSYSKLEQTVEGPDSDVMHQQPSQPVSVN